MSRSVPPLLRIQGLGKTFGATRALQHVDFEVAPGEIVALMGANGAGKTTLVNIIAGAFTADSGTLEFDGAPYRPNSPREAARRGVMVVHQSTERVGAPGQTVADALLLDRYASGQAGWWMSRARARRMAQDIVAQAGFALDVDADFADLGPAERQLVAIARALGSHAKLLILDEPTASLSQREAQRLFGILQGLRERGLAILYISHRTADLQALADRVVVLRGGVIAAQFQRPVDFDAAISTMIGRPLQQARAERRAVQPEVVLDLQGLQLLPGGAPWDLQVHRGEVVAVTGPLGAGKSRLLRCLFGLQSWAGGVARLQGQSYAPRSPAEALAAGVGLAGEDRHRSSLMPAGWPGATVAGTIALPHLRRWFPWGWRSASVEQQVAAQSIERLAIRASGPVAPIESLSGGNQQKVVLARWQAEPLQLLLLDEPFQGVDVGARADIIASIRADGRCATLLMTSDPEEALEVADRLYVMEQHTLRPWSDAAHAAAA